ncbi:MAG: hypothetical protein AAF560_00420 [Acidobacteriota bacterium]
MQLDPVEPTQYLMVTSLLQDGDLTCDAGDLARLFHDFPFASGAKLELVSADAWQTTRFAEPLIYPLLAAPWVLVVGANGLVVLNTLCFLLVVYLAWRRLSRWNSDGTALLYAIGFFTLSGAFVYLFRMQPQILIMATVALAYDRLWPEKPSEAGQPSLRSTLLSGSVLALALVQSPGLIWLVIPLLFRLEPHPRRFAAWFAAALATTALVFVVSEQLVEHPGIGKARASDRLDVATFSVDHPLSVPWLEQDLLQSPADTATKPQRSFANLLEDLGFLLWGRRGGLLLYFPLVLPVLFVFAGYGPRYRFHWLLLAALSMLGVTQVWLEPVALARHVGQIGNPHAVGVYSLFLFLVARIPVAMITASYALGALVLSTLLLTPFGAVVPYAPNQAHTRNFPFTWLPFEYPTLDKATDFRRLEAFNIDSERIETALISAPSDQTEIFGDELWLLGGESVEAWIESPREIPTAVLAVRNLAPHNRITVDFAGARERRDFGDVPPSGITFQLELTPNGPSRVRYTPEGALYIYRMRLASTFGEKPRWRQDIPANDYLGLAVSFLGTREVLGQDYYHVEWKTCTAPHVVKAKEEFLALTRLRNTSEQIWPHRGAARFRLSYRWLDATGKEIPEAGIRTELDQPVPPDTEVTSWLQVRAPRQPGHYVLEIDPLLENVAWFSHRNPDAPCQTEVEVLSISH